MDASEEFDGRPRTGDVTLVDVDDLVSENTARSGGLDMTHVRALAEVVEDLPPLLVQRDGMRVVDGHHRLRAFRLCGHREVPVRTVEGDATEALVIALRANTTHGLPLPLADRKAAAERLVALRPTWSNRRIATVTALSPKTVGQCRRRVGGEVSAVVGSDDRVRPVDAAAGRRRAEAVLRENPDLSLRKVARAAGISPETVRSVRARMAAGEDVTARAVPRTPDGDPSAATPGPSAGATGPTIDVLRRDPAVRQSEAGRALLRVLDVRALRTDQVSTLIGTMPAHARPQFAQAVRECAEVWSALAERCGDRSGIAA